MNANLPSNQSLYSSSRFSCALEPTRIQAGEEIRVQITNTGHTGETFTVKSRSRDFQFLPRATQTVNLRPGQSETVSFTVQPSRFPYIGSKEDRDIRVLVQASKGGAQILKGKISSQAILSIGQTLVILLILFSIFFISRKTQSAEGFTLFATDTPTPTRTPLPTLTPTPAPHEGEVLYLSFDDGPSVWTQDILALLAKYDVKATFFIIGQQVEDYEDVILAEEHAGHTIAHHTWSHISVNGIGFDAFAEQIYLTNAVLPTDAAPCIRLPFADEGYQTEGYAEAMGLEVVWWDIDPFDWGSPGQDYIEEFVISEASDGKIILLHDGGGNRAQTVAALDRILRELTTQGYRFETLCE